MPAALLIALSAAGAAALSVWLGCLADPARAWDFRPVAEDSPPPPLPSAWPSVRIVVPARDEAAILPETLPALLAQEYPGAWGIVVVDDRSSDGTAAVARAVGGGGASRDVVAGTALPDGWAGKVWALAQGIEAAGVADYLLLTDADIRHAPGSCSTAGWPG